MTESKLPPFGFYCDRCTWKSIRDDTPLLYRVVQNCSKTIFDPEGDFTFVSQMSYTCRNPGRYRSDKPTYDVAFKFISGDRDFGKAGRYSNRPNYISTSASLTYAMRLCNQHFTGVGSWTPDEDVKLVVIDSSRIGDRAYTTLECLVHAPEDAREAIMAQFESVDAGKRAHEKWANIANATQEVLVADIIPKSAIVGIVKFKELVTLLPRWFLNTNGSFITRTQGVGGAIRETFYAICAKYARERICPSGPDSADARLHAFMTADLIINQPRRKITVGQPYGHEMDAGEAEHRRHLITYLASYFLTFPITKWAPDPFRCSQDLPRPVWDIDGVFSGDERQRFRTFIERKIREREEKEALTEALMQKLLACLRVEGVSEDLRRDWQMLLLTQIEKVMSQRLYCKYRSSKKLSDLGEVIKSHLTRLGSHTANLPNDKFSAALEALTDSLFKSDFNMFTDKELEDEQRDVEDMEEEEKDGGETEIILPLTNPAADFSRYRNTTQRQNARSCRGVRSDDRDDTESLVSIRTMSSAYATPESSPLRPRANDENRRASRFG